MTLATKNGSIIVKDGKLAESCGCCGGWYCYVECCPVTSQMPTSVVVTLSSQAQDQYSWVLYKDNSTGQTAIAQTSFMSAAGVNGSHVLQSDGQGVFSFNNDSLSLQCGVNTSPLSGQASFSLFIAAGFLRIVQEYGPSAAVRSKATMGSSAWSEQTETGQFRFATMGDPYFWRSSPAARSNSGASHPYIELERRCGISPECNIQGAYTYYFLGSLNNTMSVSLNGDSCSFMVGDEFVSSACSRCLTSLLSARSGILRRAVYLGSVLDGMSGDVASQVDERAGSGYTNYAVYTLPFEIVSVKLVFPNSEMFVEI